MKYSVKYKLPTQQLFRTIKGVIGDGFMDNNLSRFFILEDESRVEIPLTAIFKFDRNRFISIKKAMEKEAGQSIPTADR